MTNEQILNQHIEDILNAIIDIRKAYSGGFTKGRTFYRTFHNGGGEILDKIDEIKEKAQESLHLMFLIDNREESK